MKIDFPDQLPAPVEWTLIWMFWKPRRRFKHWRWTVDHMGCHMDHYWVYLD